MSATSVPTPTKPPSRIRGSRSFVDIMPIATLLVLILIMSIGSRNFLRPSNLLGLLQDSAVFLVLALGQTFVILLGSIDLTIAAVAAFSTIVVAMLLPVIGPWAFVVGALVGMTSGLVTGLIHTKGRIPSFIATLGISGIWAGMAFVVSDATPVTISNEHIPYLEWVTGRTYGVANIVLVAAIVLLITYIIEALTPIGRYIKAIGAGERASAVSGVNIDKFKTLAFVISGTLAGIAGVMLAARMASGSARMADGMQMKAIAIVVLGGTAISGGVGGVMRTLIGALIIIVLENGMAMIGVNPWFRQAIYGAIIIAAVALTIDRQRITIIK